MQKDRSLVGTSAIQVVPGLRLKNISVCCAMTKDGIVNFVTQTTAFKTITFSDFIDNLMMDINLKTIDKAVVVLDNFPFHKHNTIREKISQSNHVLLYLPTYLPFLNPIENMFSKWKLLIRQARPVNEAQLFELIDSCSHLITENDCNGY